MHYTAIEYGRIFFDKYGRYKEKPTIVDIGSQNVNGSLREVAPVNAKYIGLDFVKGKGVDIVLQDPYHFPLADNSADIVVTSSCLEHSEFFWLTFMEAIRTLKPDGVLYINAPSNGSYHTYPTDNWRFYPDASKALSSYANSHGLNTAVLESFIGKQHHSEWNDFIAVIVKDKNYANLYPEKIYNNTTGNLKPTNVWVYGKDDIIDLRSEPEDLVNLKASLNQLEKFNSKIDKLDSSSCFIGFLLGLILAYTIYKLKTKKLS